MIEAQALSKSYGDFKALDDVSFSVGAGEIVGLLGHNGAGKTTTLKILTGFLQPDGGSIHIGGVNSVDVIENPQAAQAMIGYLPENAPVYSELSVQDYLSMVADVRGLPNKLEAIREAVIATALQDRLTTPIAQLSKGYRQRVGIAQAILHKPQLLILDEPTVGLDPSQLIEIRNLIKRLSEHSTILFSTHILPEVEALCDRAIILMNGKVRSDAQLDVLAGTSSALLVLEDDVIGAAEVLRNITGVDSVERVAQTSVRDAANQVAYRMTAFPNVDINPQLFAVAKEQNWPLRELRYETQTLETVFNQLSQGQ